MIHKKCVSDSDRSLVSIVKSNNKLTLNFWKAMYNNFLPLPPLIIGHGHAKQKSMMTMK